MMKQIEKFLVIILILTLISLAVSFFSPGLLVRIYDAAEYGKISLFHKFIAAIPLIFKVLVYICVGIWLFVAAREHKAQPWLWLVFGLFFGLIAAVLFYLTRIYDMLKSELRKEDKT